MFDAILLAHDDSSSAAIESLATESQLISFQKTLEIARNSVES
jgi:hypothetical protein